MLASERIAAAHVQTLAPTGARVVHAIAGRVRFVLSGDEVGRGLQLANRFSRHPAVRHVRWWESARSLTVSYDPAIPFDAILTTLPQPGPAATSVEQASWRDYRTAGCATLGIVAAISGLELIAWLPVVVSTVPRLRKAMASKHAGPLLPGALDVLGASTDLGIIVDVVSLLLIRGR